MPIYEYQCPRGHITERYSTVEARLAETACCCGKIAIRAILSPPRVFGDYAGYESPATGMWVEGRRARVEDLKRSGCRPYEGGEREELVRRQAVNDRKTDAVVDEAVERTMNDITL